MKKFNGAILYTLATLIVLSIVIVYVYSRIKGLNIVEVETALINAFMLIIGYYWGSSKGSSDKNKMFAPQVYGCTDPKADNFNSSATIDDGSCTYKANPGNNG